MIKCIKPLALACMLTPFALSAAEYPNKPIRMLVGFAPGGGTDTTARAMGGKLAQRLGQQVIIDNRPGAAGNIATEITARFILIFRTFLPDFYDYICKLPVVGHYLSN
jgi:tripartite-type tricarboxylate transporter receptor subunit TctC